MYNIIVTECPSVCHVLDPSVYMLGPCIRVCGSDPSVYMLGPSMYMLGSSVYVLDPSVNTCVVLF